MSQQEFVPESQSQAHDPLRDDEVYYPRAPYSWSGKLDKEATPRDVPPSSYGEPRVQGYSAQTNAGQNDAAGAGQGGGGAGTSSSQAWQRQRGSSGNTNGYQRGYGPYNSYNAGQRVPPWARPQQHRRAPFRFGVILLILVVIALIQGLLAGGGGFVGVTGDVFGAIFGLLVLVLIVPLIILVVFSGLLMRMFRSGGLYRRRRRWGGRQWRRGPYWW